MLNPDHILQGTIYVKFNDDGPPDLLAVIDDKVIPTMNLDEFTKTFGVEVPRETVNGYEPFAVMVNPEVIR